MSLYEFKHSYNQFILNVKVQRVDKHHILFLLKD